jgi:hypothetical protein
MLKTLVSISTQDVSLARLQTTLANRSTAPLLTPDARLLCDALGLRGVVELDAAGLSQAEALNRAAADGNEPVLALLPCGTRLHKRFFSRCLDAMARTGADAAFSIHTAGYSDMRAFIRRRPFRPDQLSRMNTVGPAVLVRRSAWERLGGLRSGQRLCLWDFWLRLLMSGGSMAEVPELLATCPPVERLSPAQDGRAKAMLVVCTPGAFEPDVCRWAMALLRGDHWAVFFEPGRIPGPRDVAAMSAGFAAPLRPGSAAWMAQRRRSAQSA